MKPDYEKIDPEDRDSVLWLKRALSKLVRGPLARVDQIDSVTRKSIMLYQHSRKLPITATPDEATMQKIRDELKERGLKP